jgi:hypothetical protein
MRTRRAFYLVVMIVMVVAFVAGYLSRPLAQALPPGRGATGAQVLQVLLGIRMLFHPVPDLVRSHLPSLLLIALFWLQAALVVRRLAIWVRRREIAAAPTMTRTWAILLAIGAGFWLLGTLIFLSPILFWLLGSNSLVQAMQIGNALFTGLVFIPAANVFGASFFAVEMLSLREEGLVGGRPPAAGTAPGTDAQRSRFARRAGWIGLIAGLAILVVPPVWSLYPTGAVFQNLCSTRAGERVLATTRVENYVLIGEGASSDGFHLEYAVEDVITRRVRFIEVPRVPNNHHQANALNSYGVDRREGEVFRVSLGTAGSANCVPRLARTYGPRVEIAEGQCLQFEAIATRQSRYRVEAVNGERGTWYTPDIRAYGVRVVDGEREVTLGEHLRFERTGMTSFLLQGDAKRGCPAVFGFRPVQLHRKVLLGER